MGSQLIPYNGTNLTVLGRTGLSTYIVGNGVLYITDPVMGTVGLPYNAASTVLFGVPISTANQGNGILITYADTAAPGSTQQSTQGYTIKVINSPAYFPTVPSGTILTSYLLPNGSYYFSNGSEIGLNTILGEASNGNIQIITKPVTVPVPAASGQGKSSSSGLIVGAVVLAGLAYLLLGGKK